MKHEAKQPSLEEVEKLLAGLIQEKTKVTTRVSPGSGRPRSPSSMPWRPPVRSSTVPSPGTGIAGVGTITMIPSRSSIR